MPSVSFNDPPSPGGDYFNDLSQQPSTNNERDQQRASPEEFSNDQIPKTKRIACVLCRKRKLRCDGGKPACGTCVRLQHDCSYDEVRRKSGPKRGYVKALEARLVQVEAMLKTQDDVPGAQQQNQQQQQRNGSGSSSNDNSQMTGIEANGASNLDPSSQMNTTAGPVPSDFSRILGENGGSNVQTEQPFPWEMIGLGLDEPLPTPDVIDELTQIYFDKIHPSSPMIHRPRYLAAMNLPPHLRPPVCLRYAMWTNAAAVSDKYEQLHEHFYVRARKYIQQDEMKGHGETMITIAHCQTWVLLATYEFKLMYFPRAWMSAGRACRISQMMGLHRLDGQGLDVKQCLAPARDWTEREERRRTFWMSFAVDRYSSIGTGWPMTIEERDIMTNLPADDESYEMSREVSTSTLRDALALEGTRDLSGFAGVTVMACLFGRNLTHLHRPSPDDDDENINGEFWKRHRNMDNILLYTALALPDPLRLPAGLNDPNVVWLNMSMHTSTICLHQAAIFKADKNGMPPHISAESKVRCITAAAEIASIMRQISHLDLSSMNPFIAFCLYVAARVFVQYLKSRPKDNQRKASLQFLLSAMNAIKRKNPLTESFLVQLDVDLQGAGLEDSRSLRARYAKQAQTGSRLPPRFDKEGNEKACVSIAFGDNGVSMYNNPNDANRSSISGPEQQQQQQPPGMMNLGPIPMDENGGFMDSRNLPHRTPGSHASSSGNVQEMDISSDGAHDNHSPSSGTNNNFSPHTSNTAYSPPVNGANGQHQQSQQQQPQQQQPQPSNVHTPFDVLFSNDGGANYSDFSLSAFGHPNNTNNSSSSTHAGNSNSSNNNSNNHSSNAAPAGATSSQQQQQQQQQQRVYPLPSNWSNNPGASGAVGGSTGLTPGAAGPTGFTPVATGGMSDFMNFSDADWNQVLEIEGLEWENSGMVEGGRGGGLLY